MLNVSCILGYFKLTYLIYHVTNDAMFNLYWSWCFNPCPATPRYTRFQADFKPNNMLLKIENIVCGRRSISQIIQFKRCIFKKNINIFRHLKLEIALAIPASNDEKYNTNF